MPPTAAAEPRPAPTTRDPEPPTLAAPLPFPLAAAPEPPFPRAAAEGADRLVLAVVRATLPLRSPDAEPLARRMRLTVSAVLLFTAGARRPVPGESAAIRRAAARRALQRLAAQVAAGESLGHFDGRTALDLLEELTAVAVALTDQPNGRPTAGGDAPPIGWPSSRTS